MPPQHTLPLRECCKDCLPCTERALSADSATYTESWTPGARRKKLLDDEEERRDHNAYISTTRHYYPRIRLDELEKLWPDPVQEAAIELEESIDELRPLPTSSVMSASTSASPSRNPSLTAKQPDARFPPLISVVERRFHPRRTVSESDVPSVLGRGPPPNRNQNARGGGRMFSWTKGPASIVKGLGGSGMIAVG